MAASNKSDKGGKSLKELWTGAFNPKKRESNRKTDPRVIARRRQKPPYLTSVLGSEYTNGVRDRLAGRGDKRKEAEEQAFQAITKLRRGALIAAIIAIVVISIGTIPYTNTAMRYAGDRYAGSLEGDTIVYTQNGETHTMLLSEAKVEEGQFSEDEPLLVIFDKLSGNYKGTYATSEYHDALATARTRNVGFVVAGFVIFILYLIVAKRLVATPWLEYLKKHPEG